MERDGKRIRYLIGEHATPIVLLEDPNTLPEYQGRTLVRDPDVLDTWFSSGLWPFSTLGWPERTPELEYYYPTSTLVTARDIIYLWVARMVMLGEKMIGREPFKDIYINGTVLDGDGVRMSKMKGNGVDPLDIIRRYGADAMRFVLTDMTTEGQDLKFPIQIVCPHCDELQDLPRKRTQPLMTCAKCKQVFQQPVPNEQPLPEPVLGTLDSPRFEKGRNFANKVWNAARYVLTGTQVAGDFNGAEIAKYLSDEDRWILSRVNSTVREVTAGLEGFHFSRAVGTLYDFFWNEFCSWYIELTKPRLAPNADPKERAAAQAVLFYTLDRCLRMLHPFCPFLTESLWSELTVRATPWAQRNLGRAEYGEGSTRSIEEPMLATAAWPNPETAFIDPEREAQFASLFETVVAVRAVRQELIDNSPKERKKDVAATLAAPLKVTIRAADRALATRLRSQSHILMRMANVDALEIVPTSRCRSRLCDVHQRRHAVRGASAGTAGRRKAPDREGDREAGAIHSEDRGKAEERELCEKRAAGTGGGRAGKAGGSEREVRKPEGRIGRIGIAQCRTSFSLFNTSRVINGAQAKACATFWSSLNETCVLDTGAGDDFGMHGFRRPPRGGRAGRRRQAAHFPDVPHVLR